MRAWCVGLVSVAGAGCVASGSVQQANTLGKGGWEISQEMSLQGGANNYSVDVFTAVNMAVRVGVSERVDLLTRFGHNGIYVGTKFQLTDPKKPAFVVSLAPMIGGGWWTNGGVDVGFQTFDLPIIIGVHMPGDHQFVFGSRVLDTFAWGVQDGEWRTGNVVGLGGFAGVVIKVTPWFRIMPELAMLVPLGKGVPGVGGGNFTYGGTDVMMQGTIGAMFGPSR